MNEQVQSFCHKVSNSMSTHPNALLIAELSPEDLPRKTYMALKAEIGKDVDADEPEIYIPTGIDSPNKWEREDNYHSFLAEDEYNESNQISAAVGSIVLWKPVTYGYGERIEWGELEARKKRLDDWCKVICEKLKCSHKIYITANYW